MSYLEMTIRPAGSVLGDNNAATYEDDATLNGGASPIIATLEVSGVLSVMRGRDAIESVIFGCVAGAESDGLLDTPLLEWTVGLNSGSEPITLGDLGLSAVETTAQQLAPSGAPWTWDDLGSLSLRVAQDVALDPGQSGTLRVAEVYEVVRLNLADSIPQTAYGRQVHSGTGRHLAWKRW